ncbi:uncharacterized protein LOC123676668 [Harmonia axyridis]|uniref:uncharacterized protein LOC123676668 n=1 Tax=Harmonia axyridis TaxID=115357 RepID=UPI001E27759C|nr:uncharacterized protein LOC123676668 [Harmonia axyridis]XP_045468719.1 uncharacterized protein LOC123676668 [Harmonia axyridis]
MVKYIAVVLVAIVALQAALVSARATAPAEPNVFDTLAADARKAVKDFADATGLSSLSSEKVISTIETDAKKVAANLDAFVEKVKKDLDAKKPEIEKVLKSVEAELTKTSDSLKKLVGPDTTKKAEELKKTFDKNLNEAIEQVNKVVKAVEPDAQKLKADIEASGQVVLKSIVDGTKKIEAAVKETVKN